jgi:hypothetical protein
MKYILALMLTASTPFTYSQSMYVKVVNIVPGTKAELFVRAKAWLVKAFVSVKDVIQMEDKEAGKIIGHGILYTPHQAMIGYSGYDPVKFTITIDVNDHRYRCVLDEFNHSQAGDMNQDNPRTLAITRKGWKHIKEEALKKSNALLDDFMTAMSINDTF